MCLRVFVCVCVCGFWCLHVCSGMFLYVCRPLWALLYVCVRVAAWCVCGACALSAPGFARVLCIGRVFCVLSAYGVSVTYLGSVCGVLRRPRGVCGVSVVCLGRLRCVCRLRAARPRCASGVFAAWVRRACGASGVSLLCIRDVSEVCL